MILSDTPSNGHSPSQPALALAGDIIGRYRISALSALLAGTQAAVLQSEINVAVYGRFKAGKSSFLNHFIGRNILPTGVVPVTSAITTLRYGERDRARAHHEDGSECEVPFDCIGGYISEKENPGNRKHIRSVTIELPDLRPLRCLSFVDTPGLESALGHNTRTSLDWLPNVGLAIVAVSVDPPLSERDIALIESLYQHTPKVAVLLTKSDLLSPNELEEVAHYVRLQLARIFPCEPQVFPYSTRPGFEQFRQALQAGLFADLLRRFSQQRESVVFHKLDTLLRECAEYLSLILKSAELDHARREAARQQLVSEDGFAEDAKSAIRLSVQAGAGGTRSMVMRRLESHRGDLERDLLLAFESEFPKWTASLAGMLFSFENWLAVALQEELTIVSVQERTAILEPLQHMRQQAARALQQFRDRLSDRTMQAFGVPLRTTETAIDAAEPGTPDIRVGRVFDRNWELLSPVIPVWTIQGIVRRHFARTISYLIDQNLSRLAAQWEKSIHDALRALEKDALGRLGELTGTVDRLLQRSANDRPFAVRADLDRLRQALAQRPVI